VCMCVSEFKIKITCLGIHCAKGILNGQVYSAHPAEQDYLALILTFLYAALTLYYPNLPSKFYYLG
jgi:hypothetical protein